MTGVDIDHIKLLDYEEQFDKLSHHITIQGSFRFIILVNIKTFTFLNHMHMKSIIEIIYSNV